MTCRGRSGQNRFGAPRFAKSPSVVSSAPRSSALPTTQCRSLPPFQQSRIPAGQQKKKKERKKGFLQDSLKLPPLSCSISLKEHSGSLPSPASQTLYLCVKTLQALAKSCFRAESKEIVSVAIVSCLLAPVLQSRIETKVNVSSTASGRSYPRFHALHFQRPLSP